MAECFDPRCGYDDWHDHGDECTLTCPCGLGRMDESGEEVTP